MKTRADLYGHEAVGLLRDIAMYRVLEKEQLLRLYPGKQDKIENLLTYLTKQGRVFFVDGRYCASLDCAEQMDRGLLAAVWVLIDFIEPVSYTHLDVYKRQLLVYGGDDSFTAYDYMENPYNNNWEVWKKWDKPKATNQGGLGIDTYIDSGANINSEWVSAAGLKGSVHFSLLPKTSLSMKINPESVTAVSADYTHNKNPLGFGLSFAFYGVSVSVAPGVLQDSISATDTIRYTYVK